MCTVLLLVCRFIIQMNSTRSLIQRQHTRLTAQQKPKHLIFEMVFYFGEGARENLHEQFPKSENFLLKYHLLRRNRNGISKRISWFSFCSSVVMHELRKVLFFPLNLALCLLCTMYIKCERWQRDIQNEILSLLMSFKPTATVR